METSLQTKQIRNQCATLEWKASRKTSSSCKKKVVLKGRCGMRSFPKFHTSRRVYRNSQQAVKCTDGDIRPKHNRRTQKLFTGYVVRINNLITSITISCTSLYLKTEKLLNSYYYILFFTTKI